MKFHDPRVVIYDRHRFIIQATGRLLCRDTNRIISISVMLPKEAKASMGGIVAA